MRLFSVLTCLWSAILSVLGGCPSDGWRSVTSTPHLSWQDLRDYMNWAPLGSQREVESVELRA